MSVNFQEQLSVNRVVMYDHEDTTVLGVITAVKNLKFTISNDRGREIDLPSNRLYPLRGTLPSNISSKEQITNFLQDLKEPASKEAKNISIEELWNLISTDHQEKYDFELCELYLGKIDLVLHTAFRLALLADRVYFRRNRFTFEPRTPEHVDELKRSEKAKHDKLIKQQEFLNFLKSRLTNSKLTVPEDIKVFINLLEEAAANGDSLPGPKHKEAETLVAFINQIIPTPDNIRVGDRAFKILEKIGYFHEDTNLSILRHKPPTTWSEESLTQAKAIATSLKDAREDLTQVYTVTIDDESTKDMDDAVSIRQVDGGYELGIHITDVASVIAEKSPLDSEAKLRASSIYAPDQTINMFPDFLSEDKLSLKEGEIRPALSAIVSISHDFQVLGYQIKKTLIRVGKRLTYDLVDEGLEQADQNLTLFYNIAVAHDEFRIRNGAQRMDKRESIVFPKSDGTLRLLIIDESSPARMLLGEMMILFNRLIAEYALENKVPLPFRGQEPSEDNSEPSVPPGPAYDYALRSRLKRSIVNTEPKFHATLGLNAYTQASSPIRRYLDLVTQRQIIYHLETGKILHTASELMDLIKELEEPLSKVNLVGRESKRYWHLKYLSIRSKKDNIIKGTVIRTDLKNPLVELDEIYINIPVKFTRGVKPGDKVTLRISRVDPRAEYIRLEEVKS